MTSGCSARINSVTSAVVSVFQIVFFEQFNIAHGFDIVIVPLVTDHVMAARFKQCSFVSEDFVLTTWSLIEIVAQ